MPSFIGTGADQVPVNSMLGSLAYQNADDVKLGKITYSGTLVGTGNVGVGGTPVDNGACITIRNPGTGSANLYLQNSTSGSSITDGVVLNYDGSNVYLWAYENIPFVVATNNTQRLRVDQSGWAAFYSGGSTVVIGSGLIADGTTNDSILRWDSAGALKICKVTSTIAQFTNAGDFELKTTGYLKLPEGTTAQRPASPQEGMIRKNSTDSDMEFYCAGNWEKVNNNLLNVRLFTTVGSQQTITLDPRTNYIIAEMIGGGGSGGSIPAGPYATNNVSVNASGSPGAAVKVLIPKSAITSTTMYYYIGDGGGFSVAGNNGGNTVLSFDPIANDTNRIIAYGGIAAPGPSPVGLPPRSVGKQSPPSEVSFNGVMTNCKLLEHSNTYGYGVTVLANPLSINMIVTNHNAGYNGVQSHSGISWGYAAAALGLVGGTFFQFGAGGRGGYGSQAEGAYIQGSSGFQGMIRIYEYS